MESDAPIDRYYRIPGALDIPVRLPAFPYPFEVEGFPMIMETRKK